MHNTVMNAMFIYSAFLSLELLPALLSSSSSTSSEYLYSSPNSPRAAATADGMMMHDGTR